MPFLPTGSPQGCVQGRGDQRQGWDGGAQMQSCRGSPKRAHGGGRGAAVSLASCTHAATEVAQGGRGQGVRYLEMQIPVG